MAKAIAFFSGIDSYCRHQEVAIREDGTQFHRYYGYNGYGKAMTKWAKLKESEHVKITEDGMHCEWGFKNLHATDPKGLRLPN